jgi:hypothetical protein
MHLIPRPDQAMDLGSDQYPGIDLNAAHFGPLRRERTALTPFGRLAEVVREEWLAQAGTG